MAYTVPAPPKGGAFVYLAVSTDKASPLGELANAVSLRGFVPAVPFAVYGPTRENAFGAQGQRPRPLRLCFANPPLPKGEALAKR